MIDQRLTAKTEITSASDDDVIYIVDVSDTTDSPEGSSRKIKKSNFVKEISETPKEQDVIGSVHTNLTASGTEIVNWSTHVHAHLLLTGNTTLLDSGRPTENHTSFTRTLRVESESTESFSLPLDITEVVGEYNASVPNLITINYVRLNGTTQITCIITPIE